MNGLRAVLRKNALQDFIASEKPDILCLQEIKAKPEQVEVPEGYNMIINSAERAGYSGTAVLIAKCLIGTSRAQGRSRPSLRGSRPFCLGRNLRQIPLSTNQTFSDSLLESTDQGLFDSENIIAVREGRVVLLDLNKFFLVNVYVPNSKPDLSRLKLRETEWDPEFLNYLKELEKTKPVVVCGDFNAAHEEIDIARPKTNHHSAGFTDEERQGITNYLNAGFIDTFRTLHPEEVRYTWWSHWGKARENNVGWRIDYFFISKSLKNNLKSAEIYEHYFGSDHCPISIELEI